MTSYEEFRTGLTCREVLQMLWSPSEDRRTWRHKRRGTVLGFWRQLKREMYDEYERRVHEARAGRRRGNDRREAA